MNDDTDGNAFLIAALRLELAETIAQRDEVARANLSLLESHRRVYLATKPVLDAVKNLVFARSQSDREDATDELIDAYNAYNPPRKWESYK